MRLTVNSLETRASCLLMSLSASVASRKKAYKKRTIEKISAVRGLKPKNSSEKVSEIHLGLHILLQGLVAILIHSVEGFPVLLNTVKTFSKEEVLRIGLVLNDLATHCHETLEVVLVTVNLRSELLVFLQQLFSFLERGKVKFCLINRSKSMLKKARASEL